MNTPRAARPFLVGQYRILVSALTLSLLGAGMWIVAVVWQVIRLGGGPSQLSLVALGGSLGLVGAVLLGGVLADRIPQRRILIGVEATKTLCVAATAALVLTGTVEVWHLAVVSFALGVADGFFYPAYSALLPSVLPADDLLAANGVEGMLRPIVMQAAGPAIASAMIAVHSPGLAFSAVAIAQALAVFGLAWMRTIPLARQSSAESHGLRSMFGDLRDGFRYVVRTPWLIGTLLFASLLVLIIMGPIEVLLPFAIKDQAGGGAGAFAMALAAFGIGGAAGSILVASLRLPRRYLTIMTMLWGAGCVPLAVIGYTSQLWVMVVALFIVGFAFSAASVIWGTLLQRRVPSHLLGRVSSLDFFVSLMFMPISMALAGPVGEWFGLAPAFLVAGVAPIALAVATVVLARMPRDELEHPLESAHVESLMDGLVGQSAPDADAGRMVDCEPEERLNE